MYNCEGRALGNRQLYTLYLWTFTNKDRHTPRDLTRHYGRTRILPCRSPPHGRLLRQQPYIPICILLAADSMSQTSEIFIPAIFSTGIFGVNTSTRGTIVLISVSTEIAP